MTITASLIGVMTEFSHEEKEASIRSTPFFYYGNTNLTD